MKNWQWSRKCLINSVLTHGLVIVLLYDASALGRRGAVWLGSNPSEQPRGLALRWGWRSGHGSPELLSPVPSHAPLRPCQFSRFPAALLDSLGSIRSPGQSTEDGTCSSALSEDGWKLALASCSIDLGCFYCFFFKTAVPETSFSPSYHQAALLFFFLPFIFKLGTTAVTIIMINSLISKRFLKKSQ